ncbi:MAG: hypothetical protein WCD12_17565 [Candidatus Binatus sp.]|uniref:hypothetical protein n=1 Tax=Candidatus Binatus sp. TaxID=2811406 RepID=UPI003C72E0A8
MDPEAAAVITPHLLAREELLWCGRPHDTTALRWRAGAIILVGIAALILRALPLDSNLAERADANSVLLAIMVGVLISEAIVFHAYLSNTFYGVTNQRVIIVSGLRQREVVAVLLALLNTPHLRVQRIHRHIELGARGEQMFQPSYLPFTNPSVAPDWTGRESYRLLALEDPRSVYDLIVESAHKLE